MGQSSTPRSEPSQNRRHIRNGSSKSEGVDSIFIRALVQASTCKKHGTNARTRSKAINPTSSFRDLKIKYPIPCPGSKRRFSTHERGHSSWNSLSQRERGVEEEYQEEQHGQDSLTAELESRQESNESRTNRKPESPIAQRDLRALPHDDIPHMAHDIALRFPVDKIFLDDLEGVTRWCTNNIWGFGKASSERRSHLLSQMKYWLKMRAEKEGFERPKDRQERLIRRDLLGLVPSSEEEWALSKKRPSSKLRRQWEITEAQDEEEEEQRETGLTSDIPVVDRDEETERIVAEIHALLREGQVRSASHEYVFNLYESLPQPRPLLLGHVLLKRILNFMHTVRRPTPEAASRYFAVLDDVKNAGLPIQVRHWNWAVMFAAGLRKTMNNSEVESALFMWKEMERSGLKSNYITFNVLLRVSLDAEDFATAHTIIEEMRKRQVPRTRHFGMSMILIHGAQKDGYGVRQAYKKMIDSGQTVNTRVLNNVIAALINCNEPVAAEQVFERMNKLAAEKNHAVRLRRDWRDERREDYTLSQLEQSDNEADRVYLEALGRDIHVGPDIVTYRHLVRYHTLETGNIDRVTELLADLGTHDETPDGAIFTYLFRGFNLFGRLPYSRWTPDRLDVIFKYLKVGLIKSPDTVWLESGLAGAVIRAYAKCTSPVRVLEVWSELDPLWKDPVLEDRDKILNLLDMVVPRTTAFWEA